MGKRKILWAWTTSSRKRYLTRLIMAFRQRQVRDLDKKRRKLYQENAMKSPEASEIGVDSDRISQAIDLLKCSGYTVIRSVDECDMLRPSDLRKRVFLKPSAFALRLSHPACPPFQSVRGPSGRIRWLQPNDALLTWLRAPLHQGRGQRSFQQGL
jgi:hypothetical protein